MKNSLIIGCARAEIINHVVSLPKGNEEVESIRTEQVIGGNGFYLAYILQCFSFPYELIAPVGTGVYGDFVREEADHYGIDLAYDSDETDGCVYRLVDEEGRQSVMYVPGGEYSFDREYLQLLDPNDIDRIVIFSEMLSDTYGMDILEASREFEKPVMIVLDGDLGDMDLSMRKALLNLSPEFVMDESDLFYLNGERNVPLDQAAETVFQQTKQPVYVMKDKEGCYVYDKAGGEFYSSKKHILIPAFASFLNAAETAGADRRSALNYAFESADACQYNMVDDDLMQERKRRLAEVIAGK